MTYYAVFARLERRHLQCLARIPRLSQRAVLIRRSAQRVLADRAAKHRRTA